MSTGPKLQRSWDWRATGNFAAGGTGSGLLIVSTVSVLQGLDAYWLLLTGTALVAAGLGLVWLEIGRPLRLLNVYRNPFTSWMSREAWLATVLIPMGVAAWWWRSPALALGAAVFAGAFLYSQARILEAARSIRAWRVSGIVALIVSTGLAEGVGALLVGWAVMDGLRAGIGAIELAFVGWTVIVLRLWAWSTYREALSHEVPTATLAVLRAAHARQVLYGHLLPAVLILAAMVLEAWAAPCLLAAGLALLLAGWALKFVILNRAAHDQGYELVHSPGRGDGRPGPGARPGWTR